MNYSNSRRFLLCEKKIIHRFSQNVIATSFSERKDTIILYIDTCKCHKEPKISIKTQCHKEPKIPIKSHSVCHKELKIPIKTQCHKEPKIPIKSHSVTKNPEYPLKVYVRIRKQSSQV